MKENKGLSTQLDAMVSQCLRMNAGKLRISFKREDGYTIEITARRTEAKFDDEFSDKELNYIKKSMVEKIGSESDKETDDISFDIINVCQELLGEPQFDSVDEILSSL